MNTLRSQNKPLFFLALPGGLIWPTRWMLESLSCGALFSAPGACIWKLMGEPLLFLQPEAKHLGFPHPMCTGRQPASASLSISLTQNKGALMVPSKSSSLLSSQSPECRQQQWVMDQRRKRMFFFSHLRNRNNKGSFPGIQCIRINTVNLGRCLGRWLATCAIKMTSEASVSPRCIYKAVCFPRPCQQSVEAVALCINKNLQIN